MNDGPRSVVIHGHFYQPPREDPWFETVPEQPSAAPFHDWNARIERECYRPIVSARLPFGEPRIRRIVNLLESISFDFGPTLLTWLETEATETYEAVLEADRLSRRRHDGHGNALAMPFHHTILPLASRRDKVTEVRWGIADFRRRFGREPEGMWLPEAAIDDETLDVLAAEGIGFTVVGPSQVERPPEAGLPGLYRTGRGRRIALFVYDGEISHGIAFGGLLDDTSAWAASLLGRHEARAGPSLASAATDGETYGHHHKGGERGLAMLLDELRRRGARVENYASFLARHPPATEVSIVEPSSWSCAHGVKRWRSECGCKMAPEKASQQKWRAPLRESMDRLAERLHVVFEGRADSLFPDPWTTRDAYGSVLGAPPPTLERFIEEQAGRPLEAAERVRALELLELERNALRLFTSCGWFFDDVAGIETIQLLRYAARAIDLVAGEGGLQLERSFRRGLSQAKSNDRQEGSAERLYDRRAKPLVPPPARAAAGLGGMSLLAQTTDRVRIGAFEGGIDGGRLLVVHTPTGRRWAFDVAADDTAGQPWEIEVTPQDDGATRRLPLAELPEEASSVIREALARTIVATRLTEEERAALLGGAEDVSSVTSHALVRAVSSLATQPAEAAIPPVEDLLDLLELLESPVPDEAQSVFWKLFMASDDVRIPPRLRPIGERLGFALDGKKS